MSDEKTSSRSPITYLTLLWIIINITLMLMMLPEDFMDLNNWIELALWTASVFALLSTKKWGTAFLIFTLCYTLSTSVGIIIYYQIWLNTIRVIINTPLIIYLFNKLFASKLN